MQGVYQKSPRATLVLIFLAAGLSAYAQSVGEFGIGQRNCT
jgi:hypothetical protein